MQKLNGVLVNVFNINLPLAIISKEFALAKKHAYGHL